MKPLKGVIRIWRQVGDRIEGIAAFHVDAIPFEYSVGRVDNPIVPGLPMRTSPLVSIIRVGGVEIAETKNSLYVLVDPAPRPQGE